MARDAVVRITGPDQAAQLERWRVVISRDGIERIEPGELAHPASG